MNILNQSLKALIEEYRAKEVSIEDTIIRLDVLFNEYIAKSEFKPEQLIEIKDVKSSVLDVLEKLKGIQVLNDNISISTLNNTLYKQKFNVA